MSCVGIVCIFQVIKSGDLMAIKSLLELVQNNIGLEVMLEHMDKEQMQQLLAIAVDVIDDKNQKFETKMSALPLIGFLVLEADETQVIAITYIFESALPSIICLG